MTADRRAHTDDKRAHSPFANSENASRAALVEKVAEAIRRDDYGLKSGFIGIAIDLIRAETLEEAEKAVRERLFNASCCCLFEAEAAIRALKGNP